MTDATKDAIERVREWAQGGTANLHPGDVYEAVAELERLARENERLRAERDELQQLFDLQRTRTKEADALWQAANEKLGTLPDLGKLVEWLMLRGDIAIAEHHAAEARAERLAEALRSARKTLIFLKTLTPGGSHAYSLVFDTLASIDAGLAAINEPKAGTE